MKEVSAKVPFTLVEHLTQPQREQVLEVLRSPVGELISSVLTNYALRSNPSVPLYRDISSAEDMYRRTLAKERIDAMMEFVEAVDALRVKPEPTKKKPVEDEDVHEEDLP